MRNRPAAVRGGFRVALRAAAATSQDLVDQQCGIAVRGIPTPPVSISFKRRDNRSAMVVVNPIFWQVWRPERLCVRAALERGDPPEECQKAAVSWVGMRPVQRHR